MNLKIIDGGGDKIALCHSPGVVISDGQSALDFFATIEYHHRCVRIALNKSAICEDFFDLRTGVAGEVAQKFVNYGIRLAVYGDFSGYKSRALADYIYECNKNGPLYFVASEDDAIAKLRP